MGLACAVPRENASLTEMFRRADDALYRAKLAGRDQVAAPSGA